MISKALISALTDHLPQAVIVIDQKEEVVYCNDSAAQFWQKDSQRLLGKQSSGLFHADVMIQEKIRGVLNSGNVFRMGGYVLKTPPLQERGAEIVIAPVRNKTGKVKQAVITLLESTTLQETQAREQEEQLSRALGTLAASLAHEIQNPLSGVRGMLQLLERDLQKSKISNSSTGMMLAELDRVERLLKQLLLHSHPLPLELISFNVHELLNALIRFEQNTATQIRFIRSFDTSLPDIQADRDKIHQVFLNLIRNAVEASKVDASASCCITMSWEARSHFVSTTIEFGGNFWTINRSPLPMAAVASMTRQATSTSASAPCAVSLSRSPSGVTGL